MKIVSMNTQTNFKGLPLKKGEQVTVPDDVADRWVKKKIAKIIGNASNENVAEKPGDPTEVNPEEQTGKNQYQGMKPKELFELCTQRGIEVEPKQSADYYIEKLVAADSSN